MAEPNSRSVVEAENSFDELIEIARGLSEVEAAKELLECSRYGETEPVRALLEVYASNIVNAKDIQHNTALHKACANGHLGVVKALLKHGALYTNNESGNTPLHWAAAQGHTEVAELILSHFPAKIFDDEKEEGVIDVLQKNNFGKSILTEAFSSTKTEVVKCLLEHSTATEDRLIDGANGKEIWDQEASEKGKEELLDGRTEVDIGAVAEGSSQGLKTSDISDIDQKLVKQAAVHDFAFVEEEKGEILRIRELPIAHPDNPFGDTAEEDTTGYAIWCASLIMARWLASPLMRGKFVGKSVVELGAGCGVPGLAVARYSEPSEVYLTDLNPTTVKNLEFNVRLNEMEDESTCSARVHAQTIDWSKRSSWPAASGSAGGTAKFEFIIGSDLIYHSSIVPILKQVVLGLLHEKRGSFLYVCPDTNRDGLMEFLEEMKAHKSENGTWNIEQEVVCPEEFKKNPLVSEDDEECFLHFNELTTHTYLLFEFTWLASESR